MRTLSAPATRVCAAYSPTRRRRRLSTAIARKPASASCPSLEAFLSRPTGGSARTRPISEADQRNIAAVTANTTPVSVTATRSPPSAGPAKLPTLSIVLEATLAAVSSAGSRAREGRIAACAGWKAVATTATSTVSP
jgi:hypothetical protein